MAARLVAATGGFRLEIGCQPSALIDAHRRIWFATASGVLRFARLQELEPPPVLVEQVRVAGEPVPALRRAVIPAGQDSFEIEYAALSLAYSDRTTCRYRLAGFESAWIEAGQRRTAAYSHAPRRDFQFEVSARQGNSDWGPVAHLDVSIEPHFLQDPLVPGAGNVPYDCGPLRRSPLANVHTEQAVGSRRGGACADRSGPA